MLCWCYRSAYSIQRYLTQLNESLGTSILIWAAPTHFLFFYFHLRAAPTHFLFFHRDNLFTIYCQCLSVCYLYYPLRRQFVSLILLSTLCKRFISLTILFSLYLSLYWSVLLIYLRTFFLSLLLQLTLYSFLNITCNTSYISLSLTLCVTIWLLYLSITHSPCYYVWLLFSSITHSVLLCMLVIPIYH